MINYTKLYKLICLLFIFFVSCSKPDNRFVGEWNATDSRGLNNIKLILDNENNVILQDGNEIIGGKNFVGKNGKKGQMKYVVDSSKNPMWMDLIFTNLETKRNDTLPKGIVRFITDNKMEYRVSSGKRCDSFTFANDESESIVFDKISNN